MEFNSSEFVLFFISFFFLYWYVFNRNIKSQNLLILAGSYIFYSWWDWKFLPLLIGSSAINYFLGIYINKTENEKRRRFLVFLGLLQGLGGLFFFKYFNFFVASLTDAFAEFNISLNVQTLNILLPLGISFYTFRTISYLLDVDSGKIEPTKDWIVFFNYVSFFPSLLAGPIDRANHLIPQLERKRENNQSQTTNGFRQILWGLFKKVVIADNCSIVTNQIFDNYHAFPASSLLLGSFLYIIELYADFSGYSDMAIGFSRLIGFNISRNFNFPFYAENIAEFWQKWHISLTSWMTEYVYTPLSFVFRGLGKLGMILAIVINFILVGLWHGANWTFILYGFLHGCYFIPLILRGTLNKKKSIANENQGLRFRKFTNRLGTFTLVMLTAILFRSKNVTQAFQYYDTIFSKSLFSTPVLPIGNLNIIVIMLFILLMLAIEWNGKEEQYGTANLFSNKPKQYRIIFSYVLVLAIFVFAGAKQQFIYFQF